jgi:hypothetical protein
VPWITRDEDVPASAEELLAQGVHLLRAVGEAVEQHERPFRSVPVRVEARLAERADVGPVEILDRLRDTDAFRVTVMQRFVGWILT